MTDKSEKREENFSKKRENMFLINEILVQLTGALVQQIIEIMTQNRTFIIYYYQHNWFSTANKNDY